MSESVLPDELSFHGNGGSFPPHGVITATDHSATVVVATWILMCMMAVTMTARFGTRSNIGDKDSLAICTASVRDQTFRLVIATSAR